MLVRVAYCLRVLAIACIAGVFAFLFSMVAAYTGWSLVVMGLTFALLVGAAAISSGRTVRERMLAAAAAFVLLLILGALFGSITLRIAVEVLIVTGAVVLLAPPARRYWDLSAP
jgi:hypothetical protein